MNDVYLLPQSNFQLLCKKGYTWFDPRLVAACAGAASAPGFWTMLDSPELALAVVDLSPPDERLAIDDDYLDHIAAAFAKVVDAKSPFTTGHSER